MTLRVKNLMGNLELSLQQPMQQMVEEASSFCSIVLSYLRKYYQNFSLDYKQYRSWDIV